MNTTKFIIAHDEVLSKSKPTKQYIPCFGVFFKYIAEYFIVYSINQGWRGTNVVISQQIANRVDIFAPYTFRRVYIAILIWRRRNHVSRYQLFTDMGGAGWHARRLKPLARISIRREKVQPNMSLLLKFFLKWQHLHQTTLFIYWG